MKLPYLILFAVLFLAGCVKNEVSEDSTEIHPNPKGLTVRTVIGLSSHLNLLEDFNPYRTDDLFNWIPQGLYYDLRDNGNDASVSGRVPLNDVVSGFSNSQLFNALQSSTTSVPSYRQSLVDQNVGNQTQGLNNIFTFYGY